MGDRSAIRIRRSGGLRIQGIAFEQAPDGVGPGDEYTRAPRDDFCEAAEALEHRQVRVHRALDLNAVRTHNAAAYEAPAVGEAERGVAPGQGLVDFAGVEHAACAESERAAQGQGLLRIEHAADKGLAFVGPEPAYAQVFLWKPFPDGEQQTGDEPQSRLPVARQ